MDVFPELTGCIVQCAMNNLPLRSQKIKKTKKKNIHTACHPLPVVSSSFISEHDFSIREALLEVVNLNPLALDSALI